MCGKQGIDQQLTRDLLTPCDFRACEVDSMEEVALEAPENFSVIPVFNYANDYVGALLPKSFVRFQVEYFKNLSFDDRGNEFVIDDSESGIHYLPIDRVSRYVESGIVPAKPDETIDVVERRLVESGVNAIPVLDAEKHVLGSIGLLEIACARKKKCCKSSAPVRLESSTVSDSSRCGS